MTVSAWEAIFMLVVLKIPLIYLAVVVWWAVRAEPEGAGSGGEEVGVPSPLTPCGWNDWKRRPLRPSPRPRHVGRARVAMRVHAR